MNKDKRPWTADDVDYWKSMVDIIIGLLLVVLLVMALVVLSLLDRKNGKGDYTAIEPSPTAVFTLTPSMLPSLPESELIASLGASTATQMIFTFLAR